MPPLTAAAEERLLHALETQVVGPAVDVAMRGYLEQFSTAVQAAVGTGTPAPGSLAAAGWPLPDLPGGSAPWPTVGDASGWWAAQVDMHVTEAVADAWQRTYLAQDGLDAIDKTSQDALADYIGQVRDRLVRGLEPPVYADSFDEVRQAVAAAEAAGWSRSRLADAIATRLDWSPSRAALQRDWDDLGGRIDAILDPYGPPGSPAREAMKAHDPRVAALQRYRSQTRLRMDADESWWRVRAQRIARTEATGAHAYGRLSALRDVGETHKKWNSAHDSRTRPSHRAADGQVVEIDKPFEVDGVHMQMPCDPTAPARLVVNCRCFLTHAEPPDDWAPPLSAVAEPESPPGPTFGTTAVDIMSDDDLEAEMTDLMGADGGMESPRFDAIMREMDRRDANRLEREAADRAMAEGGWGTSIADEDRQMIDALRYGPGGKPRPSRLSGEAQMRTEYEAWIEMQYARAEEATNGFMLSPQGLALERSGDLHVRDLFTKQRRNLSDYATPELQEWFAANPRMSFPEFKAMTNSDTSRASREARQRFRDRGWESEYG